MSPLNGGSSLRIRVFWDISFTAKLLLFLVFRAGACGRGEWWHLSLHFHASGNRCEQWSFRVSECDARYHLMQTKRRLNALLEAFAQLLWRLSLYNAYFQRECVSPGRRRKWVARVLWFGILPGRLFRNGPCLDGDWKIFQVSFSLQSLFWRSGVVVIHVWSRPNKVLVLVSAGFQRASHTCLFMVPCWWVSGAPIKTTYRCVFALVVAILVAYFAEFNRVWYRHMLLFLFCSMDLQPRPCLMRIQNAI